VYKRKIAKSVTGGYFGEVTDLPGCWAQGETIAEVLDALTDAEKLWIQVQLEDGHSVPPYYEFLTTNSVA